MTKMESEALRMRLAWLVAGAMVVTGVLAGSGCSSGPSRDGEKTSSASQAIQGGSTDSTNKFAVGVCAGSGPVGSGNCFGICSGALILPNVVATARHCVDQSPQIVKCDENPTFGNRKGGTFRVTTNTTMGAAQTGWYAVSSNGIYVPEDDHICGNDIALLVLSQSIPSSVAKPITPGIQYLMWDPDQYAPYFVGIGYGNTSPNGGGSGTRRISKPISVLCIPGSTDMPCPKEFSPKEFVGGDGTCSGDSGSSAYESASMDKGAPVSFGVLSRGGESADGTMCQGSAYTRFDAHRDFVLAVAKLASNDWSLYPEPSWTAYKPPPSPKPKDAGAKDSGPTTKPSGLGLGEACETEDDCSSGVCSDTGDGTLICSRACDESGEASCPEGYECRESLCLPPVEPTTPAAAPTTITTTSCAAGSSSSGSASWAFAVFGAAIALGAARRRKR